MDSGTLPYTHMLQAAPAAQTPDYLWALPHHLGKPPQGLAEVSQIFRLQTLPSLPLYYRALRKTGRGSIKEAVCDIPEQPSLINPLLFWLQRNQNEMYLASYSNLSGCHTLINMNKKKIENKQQ